MSMLLHKTRSAVRRCEPADHRRDIVRAGLVETAKERCENDQPCRHCIQWARLLHAEFLSQMPPDVLRLSAQDVVAILRSDGCDA